MQTIDCFWEKENLGVTARELVFAEGEPFDPAAVEAAAAGVAYAVVKVPVGDPAFLFGLPALGFSCVETQLSVSKPYAEFDFDDRLVRLLSRGIRFEPVTDAAGVDAVVEAITEDMFRTDRIALDPHFGPAKGRTRYVNWLRSTVAGPDAVLFEFMKGDARYGFSLCRKESSGEWDYLLGGIYSAYRNSGLGLLTPAAPFLFARQEGCPLTRVKTSISSNNVPVVRLYAHLGYVLDLSRYVYVKHNPDAR